MALPSTIYRVNIQLSDVDKGRYESLQTTVARHPSETEERLVARLLACLLFYDQELAFTKGVSAGDEPDLWRKGPDGRVRLWIEVGLPESDRLVKASRHAEQTALLACGRAKQNWEQQHLPRLAAVSNLCVLSFDQVFMDSLSSRLERSVNWSVTVTDSNMYVNIGDETFETVIRELVGRR